MWNPAPLTDLPDDGLYPPSIKRHSLEKILAHNHNVQMFSTGLKDSWAQRAYIGLYSGAGRARLEDTGDIVETTATAVFRLPHPFTHYVFVDSDSRCTSALERRVRSVAPDANLTVLTGDANALVERVLEALPRFSRDNGLISYCFVDPFDAALRFSTLKALARRRMDFLVLLALGHDARRNFRSYLRTDSARLGELVDDPGWRDEWRTSRGRGEGVIHFLIRKFDEAMVRIGYKSTPTELALPVRVHGKRVLLYDLVFYSRSDRGRDFWQKTRRGVQSQHDLFG